MVFFDCNNPGTSADSSLSTLESEVDKMGQLYQLSNKLLGEALVKLCCGINVSNIASKVCL